MKRRKDSTSPSESVNGFLVVCHFNFSLYLALFCVTERKKERKDYHIKEEALRRIHFSHSSPFTLIPISCKLIHQDMWDVLKDYPAARVRLEAIAVKRLEKYRKEPLKQSE